MQNKPLARINVGVRALQKVHVSSANSQGFRTSHVPLREYRKLSKAQSAANETISAATTKNEYEGVNTRQLYAGKKALVVGAGPAGSVAASFLAKQGFIVDVYEKRGDPNEINLASNRTIIMRLTVESANVLEAADVEVPNEDRVYYNGIQLARGKTYDALDLVKSVEKGSILMKGDKSQQLSPPSLKTFFAERNEFSKCVLNDVRTQNSHGVSFHFYHACIGANLAERKVQFLDKENNIVQESYDLLVGADGIGSEIRKAMENEIDGFKAFKKESMRYYVSFKLDKIPEDQIGINYKRMLEPGIITVNFDLKTSDGSEGLEGMLLAHFGSGRIVGTTSGSEIGFKAVEGREREYLKDVLPDDFPQEWVDQVALQLRNTPKRKIPSILEVTTLVGPRVALLGDASHAVGPRLGTGRNMAIQDTKALYNALEAAKGDLDQALQAYNDVRHEEVKQIQFIVKIASAGSTKHKGISKLLPILRWMHYAFHEEGNKRVPWLIPTSPIARFSTLEIPAKTAVQILKLELISLLTVTAVLLLGSFGTVASML